MKDTQAINEISIENKIIVVDTTTIQKLFEYKNGGDLVALYMFYHKQCKLQKTNQSFSTSNFTKKGLGWGDVRFKKAKKILIDLGLIENIKDIGKDGKIKGWYIKLNYIQSFKQDNLTSGAKMHRVVSSTPGFQDTNALSNKLEMLKTNNINASADDFDDDLSLAKNNLNRNLLANDINTDTKKIEKEKLIANVESIYNLYRQEFTNKRNNKKLAFERIEKQLKEFTVEELKNAIKSYKADKKDTIKQGDRIYIKTAENFFGFERGTRVWFIHKYIGNDEPIKKKPRFIDYEEEIVI